MTIVTPIDCSGLRSEVAALDCSLAAAEADGTERLTITRSATDQDRSGDVVAVSGWAMRDLDHWADMQGHGREEPAFGPSVGSVWRSPPCILCGGPNDTETVRFSSCSVADGRDHDDG